MPEIGELADEEFPDGQFFGGCLYFVSKHALVALTKVIQDGKPR